MARTLVALSGSIAGRSFPLEQDRTDVGREPGNDVVVDTQWASRRHCSVEKRADGLFVVDHDSHNGTTVNGVPVKERLLRDGDRLEVGGVAFVVVDDQSPSGGDPQTLELDEAPLSSKDTVQLSAVESIYRDETKLAGAVFAPGEASKALAATIAILGALGKTRDEGLAPAILERFVELLPAERGAILLGSSVDALTPVAFRPERFSVSRSALQTVLEQKAAILTNRPSDDLGAKSVSVVTSGVTSLVCLPLLAADDVIGAIYLDRRDGAAGFPESQLELLVGLALVAASALGKSQQVLELQAENRRLNDELELEHDMVGESECLVAAQKILARAAPTDATVLIEGESGTGKELAARAIHRNSPRRDAPFVKVDCTGLTENLLASELFGHEKGAFTGAIQQKKGKLEVADGGTVFLDEIGELPLPMQASLLRVLQDREFERVGGTRPLKIDIRLVTATNRDLKAEVDKGQFREDLFFRINVVRLTLPPLRERHGDVPLLARYYANEFAKRVKRDVTGIAPEALALLERYDWPGNIRELANTMERAVVLGVAETIVPDDLPEVFAESKALKAGAGGAGAETGATAATTYHEAVALRKKELILDAVSRAGGNITDAARLLDLHPNYLHRLIRNLDLRDQLE